MTYLLIALALLATTLRPKTPRDGPRPRRARAASEAVLSHDIELFAACLKAGLGPAQATRAVAETSPVEAWGSTAALLALGVPAAEAWEPIAAVPGLEELASLNVLSGQSGAAIATGAERISAGLRDQAADAATARAERAGVFIALPLAACFLPAFILLGLVPIVISLGAEILP